MEYSIGEVAEKFNLSISQIRYYDKEGLLPSIKRVNGIRKFTDQDFEVIFIIECLKDAGLSIKEIKQFIEWTKMGDSTIDLRLDFFKTHEKKIKDQIAELERTLKMVQYKCWYYQTTKNLGSVEKLEKMKSSITPDAIMELYNDAHKKFNLNNK